MKTRLNEKKFVLTFIFIIFLLFLVAYIMGGKIKNSDKKTGAEGEVFVSRPEYERYCTEDGLVYYIIENELEKYVSLVAYEGDEKEIIIPDTINGIEVKVIESSAFAYNESINSITISKNIKSIGITAFGGCSALKEVTVVGDDTEVGFSCFINCSDELIVYCSGESKAKEYCMANGIRTEEKN